LGGDKCGIANFLWRLPSIRHGVSLSYAIGICFHPLLRPAVVARGEEDGSAPEVQAA
jgi:hypothetical protein